MRYVQTYMGPFLCFIKKWHYLLRSTVYTAFHLIPVKWNKLLYNFIFVRWGAFGQAAPQFLQLEHDCKLKITHTVDCISKSFCKTTETQYKFVNLAAKSLDSLLAVRHHIHKCVRSQLGHCFLRFFSCHFHTLFFLQMSSRWEMLWNRYTWRKCRKKFSDPLLK